MTLGQRWERAVAESWGGRGDFSEGSYQSPSLPLVLGAHLRTTEDLPGSVCTCLPWSSEDRMSGYHAHGCWDRSKPHLVTLEEDCLSIILQCHVGQLSSKLPPERALEWCLFVCLALRNSVHKI